MDGINTSVTFKRQLMSFSRNLEKTNCSLRVNKIINKQTTVPAGMLEFNINIPGTQASRIHSKEYLRGYILTVICSFARVYRKWEKLNL